MDILKSTKKPTPCPHGGRRLTIQQIHIYCYELNFDPHSYVKTLTVNVIVIGDGILERGWWCSTSGDGILQR
jgi:hypothetical protein